MAFDLAAYAVKLHDYGFAPIALYCPEIDLAGNVVGCNCWRGVQCPPKNWGKHPVNPGWQSQTHLYQDPHLIRREFSHGIREQLNIGCATGPIAGLLCLDIDVGDGKPGMQELQRLEEMNGALPATPTVITGSDGRHFYFRHPSGLIIKNSASGIGTGIDVRARGGQAVLPPSLHKTGRRYHWAAGRGPWQVEVAELPPAWVEALIRHQEKMRERADRRERPLARAMPEMTLDQARNLLATMLEHPLIEWACSSPNDVSREVWRGIATNLAIPALEHDQLHDTARQAFHAISHDYNRYSPYETDQTFDDALRSADTHGPITFAHMQQHGAPDEECESQGGSSLVHAARRTLSRSSPCRTSTASSRN